MNRLLESAGISFLNALGSTVVALIFWKGAINLTKDLENFLGILAILTTGYATAMLTYCIGFLLAYADDCWTEFKNFVKN